MAKEREVEGDLMLGDMGDGMPFRAGCFDGAVSISALQWLCNADKAYHKPAKRLAKFFSSLYASLVSHTLYSFNVKVKPNQDLCFLLRVEVPGLCFSSIQKTPHRSK